MCGERSQSQSKHSILRLCKKKKYVFAMFFFGEASFALCSEVTRPQLMLGTDWEWPFMKIFSLRFRGALIANHHQMKTFALFWHPVRRIL